MLLIATQNVISMTTIGILPLNLNLEPKLKLGPPKPQIGTKTWPRQHTPGTIEV